MPLNLWDGQLILQQTVRPEFHYHPSTSEPRLRMLPCGMVELSATTISRKRSRFGKIYGRSLYVICRLIMLSFCPGLPGNYEYCQLAS
jgi:hypothetical protein